MMREDTSTNRARFSASLRERFIAFLSVKTKGA